METYPNSSFTPAAPAPAAAPNRPPNRLPWLLLLLLGVIVLAFVPALMERIEYQRTRGELRAIQETVPGWNLKALGKAGTLVYRKVKPSVVHIDTRGQSQERVDPFSRKFGGHSDETYEERGEASGVIMDEAGYIVTDFHVIERASEITVALADHRTFSAKVVGTDPAIDLAVLEISAPGLIAATWGDSAKLEVGEMVWAIGNPFGLDQTITSGIVSAKERRGVGPSAYQEFLQTDVAVNPGNSGGPLVDINGDVVGINTAIIGNAYQGISFAIPSNLAKATYEKIRANGKVVRGYLGVALAPLSAEAAKTYHFPADRTSGALVLRAAPGSPAAEAGLLDGDVIIEWNNQPVPDDRTLPLMVAGTEVGTKVPVKLIRDGNEMVVDVTVTERPSQAR